MLQEDVAFALGKPDDPQRHLDDLILANFEGPKPARRYLQSFISPFPSVKS